MITNAFECVVFTRILIKMLKSNGKYIVISHARRSTLHNQMLFMRYLLLFKTEIENKQPFSNSNAKTFNQTMGFCQRKTQMESISLRFEEKKKK